MGKHMVRMTVFTNTISTLFEPRHEISNKMVCATSIASDQPAHTRSLIRAFACRLNIQWVLSYWQNIIYSFLALKEAAQACLSLHLSKCHIVGKHMSWLIYILSLDKVAFIPCCQVLFIVLLVCLLVLIVYELIDIKCTYLFIICFSLFLGVYLSSSLFLYFYLLYTYNWYDFRTVCFLATWYRKPDQRTEVFWIHITIL